MNHLSNKYEAPEELKIEMLAGQGMGTGVASKILSNISILALILFITYLLNNSFYIPALLFVIMIVLGFTPLEKISNILGFFLIIGLGIYFLLNKHYTALFMMIAVYIINILPIVLGKRNVKKLIRSNSPIINPFEGSVSLNYYSFLQYVFFAVALLTKGALSIIFWVLFGIVTLLMIVFPYLGRCSQPWRQIHFSLMSRYSVVVGRALGTKMYEGSELDMDDALCEFVKSIYPDISNENAKLYVAEVNRKMDTFVDKEHLCDAFKKEYSIIDENKFNDYLNDLHEFFKKKNPRWIIAEVVEQIYGEQERTKYLRAVINRKAF